MKTREGGKYIEINAELTIQWYTLAPKACNLCPHG
jgi:hypothetical protein